MLFQDMLDETFYKWHNRNGFFYVGIIFVTSVMESNKVSVIVIDPGGGNDRASKIVFNAFYNSVWIAFVRFQGFVLHEKHVGNNTVYGVEKTVKKETVM